MVPSELQDLRILLVDDEPIIVEFSATILSSFGFTQLEKLTDPRNVVKSVLADRPDLIILDVNMPHLDGFEVMEQVRAVLPPEEYLPILIVTSYDDQETKERAYQSGAADFLNKPIQPPELVVRTTNLLRARWQHRQLAARNEALDREIRVQKQLSDSLALMSVRLSALLTHLQAGVLVEDEHQHVVLVNHQFCDLFNLGVLPAKLVGARSMDVEAKYQAAFANPEQFLERTRAILKSKRRVTSEKLTFADGRVVERDYIPIFREGEYSGHLWTYRNVSEDKRELPRE